MCFLVIEALLAGFFLLFIVSGICTTMHIGNWAGAFISLVLFIACVRRQQLAEAISTLWQTRGGKVLIIIFSAIVIACVITALFISVMMIKAADDPPEKPVPVIVLGCRVKENGPSLMLSKRIDAAYDYLSKNPSAVCIASGGKGADEPYSEAEAIKNALIAVGISEDRLILEDKSENTFQNIRNSKAILNSLGYSDEAVIVTSEFHQLRARLIAQKQGLSVSSISSATYLPLLPSYWIREWFGVAHEYLIGRK